jgi:hypothetical protein
MKSYQSWVVRLGLAGLLAVALTTSTAALAVTMGPQSAGYSPGSTSRVPIVLDVGSALTDRMGFSLEVTPSPGAPALTQNLGFEAVDVPSPGMVNPTTTNISVAWFSTISPARTGQITLGNVLVPIPSGASMSDTYTVHMLNAGASYLGDELLPMVLGADVVLGAPAGPPIITITITLQQVGVDVSPTNWALGIIGFGQSKSSWASGSPGAFTATNTGNVQEDFTISATATSPSGWLPGPAPDVNTFRICYGIGSDPYTSEPSWTCFDESPVAMDGPIDIAADLPFDLRFTAPTSGTTGGASETFVISLAAGAH